MGTLSPELAKEGHIFTPVLTQHTKLFKMVDNVETTTPTVEEVTPASNGTSETATEEVTAAAKENGANGTHEAEKTEDTTTETEKAEFNGEAVKDAAPEEEKDTPVETEEATKRKADEPCEDETSERIAKLKETAAEVVAEAEQKLPEEPLTEAEATA